MPLGLTLATALRDPEVRETLPATAAALRGWDGVGLPDEAAFAALARELAAADRTQSIGALTRRLNFEQPGLRTLLLRTA
ncbi:MAG: ABC transporter permease, partial [Gemmatimonadaceae bacterium]|nr:ABC transporter permease [Acetobacteraceae bacterium]